MINDSLHLWTVLVSSFLVSCQHIIFGHDSIIVEDGCSYY
jgi:hypothetical protein